jgi:hypothetical protein
VLFALESVPISRTSNHRLVQGQVSLLSETCDNVVESASARIAEHFHQLLEPMVPTSGTGSEIEGLGERLVRDAHAEPDSNILSTHTPDRTSANLYRHPPITLPWVL